MARRLMVGATLMIAWLMATAGAASAGVANAGLPGASATNPIAGMSWGVYRGPLDGLWPAYQQSGGSDRQLLAKEALRPSVHWLGFWDSDSSAGFDAQEIIRYSGGPNVLTQIAVFRLHPWEGQACHQAQGPADERSYRDWIDNFARGVGSARVLLLLQPDLPFWRCQPGHSRAALALTAYASRVLSALPHATVYIDAGAADYLSYTDAAYMLEHAGIRYARGFSLNTTHSDGTGRQIYYGASVAKLLARAGFPHRHFVVNTAQNGAPFRTYQAQLRGIHPTACTQKGGYYCLTLGIPPTSDVANRRWGLSGPQRGLATALCDGYIWDSRPWLQNGAGAFDLQQALDLARTTPF